ncbi:unnamed protein product [Arctia plantaginis]|uniref:Protein AF-10 n=1 Tax=Arctia plantaginis TaxID=874455 RepID=A0A8S1BKU0_ARCPL|nr:unnamed protein product [Arctia plantaginis]
MKEMVGGCCVCSDERGWPDNPLVYCDGNGCTVAVHQACYGIVTVPTGPWYCRKCESGETKAKVRCELCPSKSGALKRSDTGGWAHVVCALYIPEVRFGNVTSMEPIVLRLIPPERYNKNCYICTDQGKSSRSNAGACMQCNKSGCKQQFHVTCAQSLGLLCEEAGNYLDNVKYCGYCQHHYSKLKKGGNVKTIPPYKPVSHDSQSSDSSCEKEGEPSPMASGSVTPTHAGKSKGPGRKSSHASTSASGSGKNTPTTSKTATSTSQPMEKKKPSPSPSRRGSSAGDGASTSKASTPAPSPQHTATHTETSQSQSQSGRGSGSSTPSAAKVTPPAASPSHSANKPAENVGVISSVASAVAASVTATTAAPVTNVTATTSVVQAAPAKTPYQESVITNAESMETKQTKKRKALNAANAAAEYASTTPTAPINEAPPPQAPATWEGNPPSAGLDVQMEPPDKVIKKAKTDNGEAAAPAPQSHFGSVSPAPPPPPPPPAHSPASHPSPRHLPSPMPGPSGLNQMTNLRSPSQPQMGIQNEMAGPPLHLFHQPHKQAAMDTSITGHSSHALPSRSWGGLNVAYEMQQDPNKPGVSGIAGTSKDMAGLGMNTIPPATIRNKKRAAMSSVVAMANNPPAMQSTSTQSLASVRRQPQPTPSTIYHEPMKDSPPSSPSSERALKPKMESSKIGSAPHMLGNELNPESGAAACLQEQLSAELAAHAANTAGVDPLIPPPLINKAAAGANSSSGRSSSGAQSLDQLLERQWEQGSQFLMEQAQHFDMVQRAYHHGLARGVGAYEMARTQQWDVASLLSCLHQLRTENVRLEDHVGNLQLRRDHLLAVNARLAIPLNTVTSGPPEPSRCQMQRDNGAQVRPPPPPVRATETITSERSHQQLIMREVQQKPS